MHPIIRIICLLLLAGFIASGKLHFVLAAALLLASVYLIAKLSVSQFWQMMLRMRWFLISIIVVYFWFTPGRAFSPELANNLWIPSIDGVEQGLLRVACLALIVAAVSAVLQSTTRDQLVAAIFSLVSWTRYIRLQPERLAVRISLTLEYLFTVQTMISEKKSQLEQTVHFKQRLRNMAKAVTAVFVNVNKKAQEEELTEVDIINAEPISLLQWLFPIALIVLFSFAAVMIPFAK